MAGNIVSFDIGSAQVKLVWLAGGACRAAAAAPVPDGLVRGGTIVSMDAMADFLHQMAREHGLPRTDRSEKLDFSVTITLQPADKEAAA